MSESFIFQVANLIAMISWLLLLIIPRSNVTKWVVRSGLVILVFAAIYTVIVLATFRPGNPGGFTSLEKVRVLFQQPYALLAGWIHYLAFDLFVGTWIRSDAEKSGVNKYLLIPILLLTFMLGPLGLLLYFIARWLKTGVNTNELFA